MTLLRRDAPLRPEPNANDRNIEDTMANSRRRGEASWFVLPKGATKEGPFTPGQLRERLAAIPLQSGMRVRKGSKGEWYPIVKAGSVFPELVKAGILFKPKPSRLLRPASRVPLHTQPPAERLPVAIEAPDQAIQAGEFHVSDFEFVSVDFAEPFAAPPQVEIINNRGYRYLPVVVDVTERQVVFQWGIKPPARPQTYQWLARGTATLTTPQGPSLRPGGSKARALGQAWWTLDVSAHSRVRGYAVCDSRSGHQIPVGEGYLCSPSRLGDRTPDLVCQKCFDQFPYDPWDGGYSGLRRGPYATQEAAIAALTKRWWEFWK